MAINLRFYVNSNLVRSNVTLTSQTFIQEIYNRVKKKFKQPLEISFINYLHQDFDFKSFEKLFRVNNSCHELCPFVTTNIGISFLLLLG